MAAAPISEGGVRRPAVDAGVPDVRGTRCAVRGGGGARAAVQLVVWPAAADADGPDPRVFSPVVDGVGAVAASHRRIWPARLDPCAWPATGAAVGLVAAESCCARPGLALVLAVQTGRGSRRGASILAPRGVVVAAAQQRGGSSLLGALDVCS
ncbi:hypothetical protein ACQJBY_044898 [Aegilops geniculata]